MPRKTGTREWAEVNKNISRGCEHNCKYCLLGNTLILMADGSQKPLIDIEIGDDIFGAVRQKRWVLTKAKVVKKWKVSKPACNIYMKNGDKLVCSKDHRWATTRWWKYTSGKEYGRSKETRSRLTPNSLIYHVDLPNKLHKRVKNIDGGRLSPTCKKFGEPLLYMRGYLSGVIKGDAHFAIHKFKHRTKENRIERSYHFRLSMKDKESIDVTKKYLSYFGVETYDHVHDGLSSIRTNKKRHRKRIQRLILFNEQKEFMRGFLAGIFDAEGYGGNKDIRVIRICNSDDKILKYIEKCLQKFDFEYVYDSVKKTRKTQIIRIRGGIKEYIRFFQLTKPKITRKFNLENFKLDRTIKVKKIEEIGTRTLYDITTTTENFIANSYLSHNCYARSNAMRFKQIHDEKEWEKKKIIPKRLEEKPRKVKGRIMFPTTHDILPSCINETVKYLKGWLEVGNEILIVSKPHFECIKRICDDLKSYKKQIVFRFTIGSMDNKVLKFWEPGAPDFEERLKALKYAYDKGFTTSVSCEPYLDEHIAGMVLKLQPYITDTIWIGKLNRIGQRVNTDGWTKDDFAYLDKVKNAQTDEFIHKLYRKFKTFKNVKWKDSIKMVLDLPEEAVG